MTQVLPREKDASGKEKPANISSARGQYNAAQYVGSRREAPCEPA
jgi:hypothetical protein